MRIKLRGLLILLALAVTACADRISTAPPPAAMLPPIAYPDTPSPARIDAPPLESPAILKLAMFDELEGWAVTETGIARTNDGGFTWYDLSPPDIKDGFSLNTFFLDPDHAWVQRPYPDTSPDSGILYHTSDGGMTWRNSVFPFSKADIHFLDEKNGWVLADLGVALGSNAVAIYQTTDGGDRWEQAYSNDPNVENAGVSLPLSGIKGGLIARDMKTAWVTGVVYAPGEVYLYRTDDGGRSWSRVALKLPEGAENAELAVYGDQMKFVSPKDGFLVINMSGESNQTAVYVTHDAGDSWTLTPTILNGALASDFLSAQEAVIYDGKQLNVTHDGAKTWVSVTPNVNFGDSFAGMEFVNASSGWVITLDTANHRSLYRTTDGGTTWSAVIP